MKGILEQLRDNSVVYQKLNSKELKECLSEMLMTKVPLGRPRIQTGLLDSYLFRWTIETEGFKLPKYYTEIFKHRYGLVQISVGKKSSLNKIIVNLQQDGEYKYSVRIGTKEVCKASSFVSALNHFKNHPDSKEDFKLELWKKKFSYYKRRNRR